MGRIQIYISLNATSDDDVMVLFLFPFAPPMQSFCFLDLCEQFVCDIMIITHYCPLLYRGAVYLIYIYIVVCPTPYS